jgi:hypothetical protein
VAGQAVLALVNPESNGLGADAVILVYHAGEKHPMQPSVDLRPKHGLMGDVPTEGAAAMPDGGRASDVSML